VNCSFLEKEKTMTKEDFIGIGQRAGTFDQSGLTFLTFEDLQDYEILQDSPKGILLKGFNSFQKKNELVFACNDETEFLKMTSSYSGYMVQFVSPAWKEDLRRRGFKVLGDMRDYWIQDLSGYSGDRTLDFGEEKEAEQISGGHPGLRGRIARIRGRKRSFDKALGIDRLGDMAVHSGG
jgi:hypothetical protein